jgi:hypothetical protein
MKTTRLTTILTSVALTVGATLVVAAPSQAAPNACGIYQGCTYEDANYGQGHINFNYNVPRYTDVGWWVPTKHPLTNDAASSAFNNGHSGQWIRVYEKDRYQGRYVTIEKNQGVPNLGSLNDLISSACFQSYCK